jgi:hypothetical protein
MRRHSLGFQLHDGLEHLIGAGSVAVSERPALTVDGEDLGKLFQDAVWIWRSRVAR